MFIYNIINFAVFFGKSILTSNKIFKTKNIVYFLTKQAKMT